MYFKCHACGGRVPQLRSPAFRAMVGSDCTAVIGDLEIGACSICGLLQKNTSEKWQETCERIYGDYRIYHQSAGQEQKALAQGDGPFGPRSELIASFLGRTANLPKQGSVLDIGCGNGAFLRAMHKAFPAWTVTGSELNETFRDDILAISPNAAFRSRTQLQSQNDSFDVVSLIHCIEHIPAPIAYLADVRQHIRPGGVLLMEVPDAEMNPFDLIVADHSSHFSKKTLAGMVEAAGYQITAYGNLVVDKEITLLAKPLLDKPAPGAKQADDDAARFAERHLTWLEQTATRCRELARDCRPFGIFGTSIAAAWIRATLEDRIDFFVEEDDLRVGRDYFGIPVLAPSDVPDGATVFVCLEPKLAAVIAARYHRDGRNYIATPLLTT